MSIFCCLRADHNAIIDPISVTFIDNTLCYPDEGHFLRVVTDTCEVLSFNEHVLWIRAYDHLIQTINCIDIRFVECRSQDLTSYLELNNQIRQSLRLVISDDTRAVALRVKVLKNTEIYGSPDQATGVRVLLSANYSRNGIIWNAIKIKFIGGTGSETQEQEQEDIQDVFQECQLDQKLIKI